MIDSNALAAASGAMLLWCKDGQDKLKIFYLWPILERLLPLETPKNSRWRYLVKVIVFVGFGTYLALMLTGAANPQQAFAAGLGWTVLLTKRT